MKITIAGYGSVGSYVAALFGDFEPTLYDPPLGLGTADDLRDADFVIVCVPTPRLPSGACDTSIVEGAVSPCSLSRASATDPGRPARRQAAADP